MPTKKIQLSKNFYFDAMQYAIRKATILGLPNSGKSYTALKIAEGLLESRIPIVAYDPAGVWWSLKTGVKGHKGYPIVVAGGEHADIPLTASSAKNIIAAAMHENISIVLDMSGEETSSKAIWRQIVKDTINYLFFHNKQYGLRHIFLEEAQEFVPQVVRGDIGDVYSAVERTIRIGRNKSLGITLVTPRASGLNKEAHELCNLNILHAQEGRNSLKQLQDWFTIKREQSGADIMESMPQLKSGECWIVGSGLEPVRIQVAARKTFHPNPEQPDVLPAKAKMQNVNKFVEKLNKQLQKDTAPPASAGKKGVGAKAAVITAPGEVEKLKKQVAAQASIIQQKDAEISQLRVDGNSVRGMYKTALVALQLVSKSTAAFAALKVPDPIKIEVRKIQPIATGHVAKPAPKAKAAANGSASPGSFKTGENGTTRMLRVVAMHDPEPVTKKRVGMIAGIPFTGRTFREYLRQLRTAGMIVDVDDKTIAISQLGKKTIGHVEPMPSDAESLVSFWSNEVGSDSGKGKILQFLYNYNGEWVNNSEIIAACGIQSDRTFREYKRQLKSLGLIEDDQNSGQSKLSSQFFDN